MKLEGKEGTGMVQSTTRSGCTAELSRLCTLYKVSCVYGLDCHILQKRFPNKAHYGHFCVRSLEPPLPPSPSNA